MKKRKFLMTTLCVVLLSGCNFSGKEKQEYLTNIERVKYYIPPFYSQKTVGKALDTYKFFTKTEWNEFTNKNNEECVLFRGYYTDEKSKNFEINIFFKMKKGYDNLRKDRCIEEGGIKVESFEYLFSIYYPVPHLNKYYSLCDVESHICNLIDLVANISRDYRIIFKKIK